VTRPSHRHRPARVSLGAVVSLLVALLLAACGATSSAENLAGSSDTAGPRAVLRLYTSFGAEVEPSLVIAQGL
jgi:hypothetical protein